MKVETYIVMNRTEIEANIPYKIVAEVIGGAKWNTGRRKRLMNESFTLTERNAIYKIYSQARSWYLVKGLPDELRITPHILRLWHRLANFCCEI